MAMINNLTANNPMMQYYNFKEEADLKAYINKLLREFDSASTKEAKEKVSSQLRSIAEGAGKSVSDFGAARTQDSSIFSPNAKLATSTQNTTTSNPIANPNPSDTAQKIDVSGYQDYQKNSAGVNGDVMNKVDGRSTADSERDWEIIKNLNKELGIATSGDQKGIWEQRSITDDRISVYDGKTGELRNGKIAAGDIVEVKSQSQGVVRFQAGGDGAINGRDDRVLAVGGQAVANGVNSGLNNINNNMAQIAPAAETAKAAVAANPALAANPAVAGLADQLENPYNLSDSNIKNLIAAILNMINKQ